MSEADKIRSDKQKWAESIGLMLNNRGEPVKMVNNTSLAQTVGLKNGTEGNVPTLIKNTASSPEFIPNVGALKVKTVFPSTKNKFEVGLNRAGATQLVEKKKS